MTLLGEHPEPDWVEVLEADDKTARVRATPPLPSGLRAEPYDLTLEREGGTITVRETTPGSRLPKQCPELHVLRGGFFCLDRQADSLDKPGEAELFWKRLADFLVHQQHAARRRKWPAGRWLSHGDQAADAQVEAEGIAVKNGWASDYADALENDEGWIADAAKRGVGPPLVSACPCEAGGAGSRGRLRCPKRKAVERIVKAEHKRRAAEKSYITSLWMRGLRCCGRVDGCGLEGLN